MKVSNQFMAQAYCLSNSTRNPQRVMTAMRRAMHDTVSLLKAIYVCDLLERLISRGLVLTGLSSMSKRTCRGLKGDKHKRIADQVMEWKYQDAKRVLKERKLCHTRMWREEGRVLEQHGVSQRFSAIWEVEKCERRIELNTKKDNKVAFLLNKYRMERAAENERRSNVDVVRGINMCDKVLSDRYESRPRCYGKVELTRDEQSVLSLTPRFSVYDRVDRVDCEVELEKCFTKLRWGRMGDRTVLENFDSDDEGDEDAGNVSRTCDSSDSVATTVVGRPRSSCSGAVASSRDSVSASDRTVSVSFDEASVVDNSCDSFSSTVCYDRRSQRPSSAGFSGDDTVLSNDSVLVGGGANLETRRRSRAERRASCGDRMSVCPPTDGRVWPYDPETSTIDLRYLRSTDLPFNSFVHMPPALEEDEEIKLQNLKRDLVKVTDEYIMENKEKKKSGQHGKYINLTKSEGRGLESLQKRKDIVVFQTDKSGRLAADSKESYVEAAMPHVREDPVVVDKQVHEKAEKEANAHSNMWLRFTRAGEFTGTSATRGYQRIKNSMKVRNHGYAPLYALRKDHKPVDDPVRGPPTRPVCGGSAAYNSKLSHLLGLFLRPVWQEQKTTCMSTEEMLAAMEEANCSDRLDETCTVGSTDVKALYPSLDISFAAEKVGEMFYQSGIEVEVVDTKELGLYLALNRTQVQLRSKGLADFCPVRRTNRGRPPTLTGCAQSQKEDKRFRPWREPLDREPDDDIKKKMIAEAITIAVEFVMRNHMYTFSGQLRRQARGGPIGLALTGDVAQVFMCWWDGEFIRRMEEAGIDVILYKRLVDDVNLVLKRLGVAREEMGDGPEDEKNMRMVQRIANGIHKSIEVTADYPSRNEDKKVPILDLRVWLARIYDQVTNDAPCFLLHEYYHKEVASRAVISARSAVPWQAKRTILTQEILRVLRNCSRRLPWSEVCAHVETYLARMQYSGYHRRFRTEVVMSALNAYDKMVERDEEGVEPLYRPRGWNEVERAKRRRAKKGDWFKGGDQRNESVVFVPATPGSELRRRYQKIIQDAKVRIAVAEVPGASLKKRIQKSDPFREKTCRDADVCMVCGDGDGGRCRREGVTYEVKCKGCEGKYIGETSRNAFSRGLEHKAGLTKQDKKSPLHLHNLERHGGRAPGFEMKVTGVFGGDALKRQVRESVMIQQTPEEELLNRRDEWRQVKLPQVRLCLS